MWPVKGLSWPPAPPPCPAQGARAEFCITYRVVESTSAQKEQEGRVDFQSENKSEEVVFVLTKMKLQKGRNCNYPLARVFWAHSESLCSVLWLRKEGI